jgi:sulfoxide reductase catalytic subunit YedY
LKRLFRPPRLANCAESQVTPEHLVLQPALVHGGSAGTMASILSPSLSSAQRLNDIATLPDPTADLYPAKANTTYPVDRPLTEERLATTYNNFTNSAATRRSRNARKRSRSGPGQSRSMAWWKSRSRSASTI